MFSATSVRDRIIWCGTDRLSMVPCGNSCLGSPLARSLNSRSPEAGSPISSPGPSRDATRPSPTLDTILRFTMSGKLKSSRCCVFPSWGAPSPSWSIDLSERSPGWVSESRRRFWPSLRDPLRLHSPTEQVQLWARPYENRSIGTECFEGCKASHPTRSIKKCFKIAFASVTVAAVMMTRNLRVVADVLGGQSSCRSGVGERLSSRRSPKGGVPGRGALRR
jgi:hypothetical protein